MLIVSWKKIQFFFLPSFIRRIASQLVFQLSSAKIAILGLQRTFVYAIDGVVYGCLYWKVGTLGNFNNKIEWSTAARFSELQVRRTDWAERFV